MISAELLSKVLNKEVEEVRGKECPLHNDKYIHYDSSDCEFVNEINIYELAHKCKEWAVDSGYVLEIIPFCVTAINLKTLERTVFRYDKDDMLNKKPYLPKYDIMACEFILEQKTT